ncbi:MAG: GTPase [Isosphaeraceae bacterium]
MSEVVAVLRNWRAWVLLVLLVGPILAYVGFGTLWLFDWGWLLYAGLAWVLCGVLYSVLAARWTKSQRPVLPPIDWDAPGTFARADREAWAMVEEEAEQAESVSLQGLTEFDLYIETGRRLASRLAAHYHPSAEDPIDRVPVVDLLTALELAAEDLNQLCRQVPGGDLVTPDHWKKAVRMAGYFQRANDIYSYLLPIFSPVSGLVRLGTQQFMGKPAWRDMQQNLLRWFFRAYVNRLGFHMIELYSGRLTIGAQQYRRLTRRGAHANGLMSEELPPLTIAVAGSRLSGKSRLLAEVEKARAGGLSRLLGKFAASGIDQSALDRLTSARWVEVPGYTVNPDGETAKDRSTRENAVAKAVEADLLILVVDARRDTIAADAAFAKDWDRWFLERPAIEPPPAIAVLTGLDDPALGGGGEWRPPYDWERGDGPREAIARDRLNVLRTQLPPAFASVVPAALPESSPFGVTEFFLPALIVQLNRAERSALIRHLHRLSNRSKAGRLLGQVGDRGKRLWKDLWAGRGGAT